MDLPLPIITELAPGADPDDTDTWHFVTEGPVAPIRRRKAVDILITGGRDDESEVTTPGSCEVTFDDRSAHLSPRNVLGQWYGQLDKNTPMRHRLLNGSDIWNRTVSPGWGTSSGGGAWTHSSTAPFSVDGTKGIASFGSAGFADYSILGESDAVNIRVHNVASMPAVTTGAAWVHATVARYADEDNHYRLHTEFGTTGDVNLKIVRRKDATNTTLYDTTASGVTYSADAQIHTVAEVSGADLRMKVWVGTDDDEPSTWQASVRDYQVDGHGVGLYEWRLATNPGSLAVHIHRFETSAILWTGNVPEWPVRWPGKTRRDATVSVVGAGILRWFEEDDSPPRSPLDMQLSGQNGHGYWRLEDASGATAGASAVPGGRAAKISDASFAGDDTLPGALTSLVLNTAVTSSVSGQVVIGSSTATGYNTLGFFKFETIPSVDRVMAVWTATGTVYRWVISANSTGFTITGYDVNGTAVVGPTSAAYAIDPTNWFALAVETTEDGGGDVDWAVQWHEIGTEPFYAPFGSYAGTADRPTGYAFYAVTDNMSVAHSWLGENTLPFVTAAFRKVANGYIGELAGDRIARIFAELDLSLALRPGDSTPLGRQRPARRQEIVREAEAADDGFLYEEGAGGGYIPHAARLNVPVAWELDWLQGHLDDSPEPSDDDQDLANEWVVERVDGSASPPTRNEESVRRFGLRPDAMQINVATDESLDDHAGWQAWKHSGLLLRWPRFTVNLVRNRDLIPGWLSCRIGSRVTIANVPDQLAGEVIDLVIMGFQQVINTHTWVVELSCAPARMYDVGVWGVSRRDARTTTLDEDLDATETAVSIKTELERETWETAGGYVVAITGEEMSVTSATSPSFSGGYYRQVLTVTRGAGPDGIVKAHSEGAEVHVREIDRPRWARK